MNRKLLVIGCGGVASVAIQKCCQNSEMFPELVLASRTVEKCDALMEQLKGKTATVYREKGERMDVATAREGELYRDQGARVLALEDGFRVEGPTAGDALDYRLMRYARNEMQLPAPDDERGSDDPAFKPTMDLVGTGDKAANAELHWRIAPPLLALAFALLAVPLARSAPRQARFGSMLLAFLAYMVGMFLMLLGTQWLAEGTIPTALGLWWLVLPMLALGTWLYLRDGRVARVRWRR